MFAEAVWSFGEVLTGALAIDNMISCRAVALAGYLGGAIRQQLNIAVEHQPDSTVNPASRLQQLGSRLVGNLCDCFTSGCAGWGLREGLAIQDVVPGDFCSNRHGSIPLAEGWGAGARASVPPRISALAFSMPSIVRNITTY
jgi:hypothetical protein